MHGSTRLLAVLCKQFGPNGYFSALWAVSRIGATPRAVVRRLVEDCLAKHHSGNKMLACLSLGGKEVAKDYHTFVMRGFAGDELAAWIFNVARRVITVFGVRDGDLGEWGGEFGNRFHLLSLIATNTGRHDYLPMLQAPGRREFRLLVYSKTPNAIERFVAEAKAVAY